VQAGETTAEDENPGLWAQAHEKSSFAGHSRDFS
jgi:hypothetical protein